MTQVAPCVLALRHHGQEIAADANMCRRLVSLIRACDSYDWPCRVIAKALAAQVAVFLEKSSAVDMLSVAMCYSLELFFAIYRELLEMAKGGFATTSHQAAMSYSSLLDRMHYVTQYVPSMQHGMYLISSQLYHKLIVEMKRAQLRDALAKEGGLQLDSPTSPVETVGAAEVQR